MISLIMFAFYVWHLHRRYAELVDAYTGVWSAHLHQLGVNSQLLRERRLMDDLVWRRNLSAARAPRFRVDYPN